MKLDKLDAAMSGLAIDDATGHPPSSVKQVVLVLSEYAATTLREAAEEYSASVEQLHAHGEDACEVLQRIVAEIDKQQGVTS